MRYRTTVKWMAGLAAVAVWLACMPAAAQTAGERVERWGIYETSLRGPDAENSFAEVQLSAEFRSKDRVVKVDGFYDGEGAYRIRFMPDAEGEWTYVTRSNAKQLDGESGRFTCVPASGGNHGPVRVRNTFHFAYADGTPYFPFGTTCYAWVHQGDELEERTLETLRTAGFNKMRMTVFPKDYTYNRNEPLYHPFARDAAGKPDLGRFNPEFFRHFEKRVAQLGELGIEADLILFHPYDRWGYARMDEASDFRYLRYLVARLAAYRNVWWSAANEYDLMQKPEDLWDRYLKFIEEHDPYGRLRSIHNGRRIYDHSKPWITHVSIQHPDTLQTMDWRERFGKPVVNDECQYEGNIPNDWGNLTAQELVHRVWNGVIEGGYVGHGETYLHPKDVLWWSKGGVLHGESYKRMAFLRKLVEETGEEITPTPRTWLWRSNASGVQGERRWTYYGGRQPAKAKIAGLADNKPYRVDIIDAWEMTVKTLSDVFRGEAEIALPGKPFTAVRLRPAD
ncbi:MAG: DUF4038 domain-containing protein [Bryobacteraceae bacterium]|nr:DUF4038 domain-containing protein [Bryobacteraceae bacterium]